MDSEHNHISGEKIKFQYWSRNLPHFFDVNKPIFITYRMKHDLPKQVMEDYTRRVDEYNKELDALGTKEREEMKRIKDAKFFTWFDELLAKAPDVPNLLQRDDIREVIAESFHYFDNQRYKLLAYSIMPNHIHVLILPKTQENGDIFPIQHIIYTWKKYTALAINRLIGKTGNFWQKEGYDHLVRDDSELANVLNYILMNPVKAGLVQQWQEWKGNYLSQDLI